MTQDRLDITPLTKALAQLNESYALVLQARAGKDATYYPQFRAATIQAFEYTYELCIKMMQRYLEMYGAQDEDAEYLKFKELMRIAAEYGLVDTPQEWEEYRKQRNITSHTYNENKAENVLRGVERFIHSAKQLTMNLDTKIHASD